VNETPTPHAEQGIWGRLRRRKLVQWTIAYVAGVWALLQGLGFLADLYGWPTGLLRVITLALALGLPIVVTLAWYHGDQGAQRVGGTELSIVAVLFLLGGGVVWYYQRTADTTTVATPVLAIEKAIPTDASIAVLPFVNMSSDKEQEYFADGIAEELLNLLAQVQGLRVIARTSSFSFKGKDLEIAEIARRLNVANVLEGSVRKSGDKLRITAQLVRASDSSHLWSQTYDRPLTDVFAVQDEIAGSVVSELKVKLLSAAPQTEQTDPRAYALFLQAREIGRQFTEAAFTQSIELYQQALALDPRYARAWVGLAFTYSSQATYGQRHPEDGSTLAREAATKALALDPESAGAHGMLGEVAITYDRDPAAAARHLEHALALDPTNPDIIDSAAFLLRRLGRLDEAIALGNYQVARDPVSSNGRDTLGYAYRYAGHLDEAIEQFRIGLSLSPGYIGGHEAVGEVLLQKGDARAALAEMQLETDEADRLTGLSMAHYALGHKAASDAALAELMQEYEKTDPYSIASVLAYRGEVDRAYEWLDKAAQYRHSVFGSLALYPMLANLHSDARWLPLLRKHGMAPEQLAAIKFDVKVPK
jgi:TolB-like protein